MTFGEKLRKIRSDKGLSQEEFGKLLKTSKQVISRYENGQRSPKISIAQKYSEMLGVSLNSLIDDSCDEILPNDNNYPAPQIANDTIVFPVVGNIAAGYNQIAVESWSGDTVEIPLSYLKGRKQEEFFVLRVDGDSMYPLYQNGDKVLILKQNTLNRSGDVGAILYDDEKATLKKVEYVQGEDWLKLLPINPSYPPETIQGEALQHCRVIGVPRLLIRNIEQ